MSSLLWNRTQDLVARIPVWVGADETLRAVARTLSSEGVGIALVSKEGKLAGVISERDVVAALAGGADADECLAGEVMHEGFVSVRPEDSVYDAAAQMLDLGIRHLPLVDRYGSPTGVVSLRDLVRPLLVEALGG